jgi:hypothetical protein
LEIGGRGRALKIIDIMDIEAKYGGLNIGVEYRKYVVNW